MAEEIVKAASILRTAGEAIGGHRVVLLLNDIAFYADQANLAHLGLVIGITPGAADLAAELRIVLEGPLYEPSWNWTEGPIYCGANAVLTQTPPTSGWLQQVATATAPTMILVDIQEPTKLA